MNLLFTIIGIQSLESQACVSEWRAEHHIVEPMPFDRVTSYLRLDLASSLALVDAIICMADNNLLAWHSDVAFPTLDFPLQKALALAEDVRNLPETCTMRDGRKWRTIPFIIFGSATNSATYQLTRDQSNADVFFSNHPNSALKRIREVVDRYHDKVLTDYRNLGILVRFDKGRAQVGPALKVKSRGAESEHYYAPGDRRNNKSWVTVKRDNEGIRQDVELFYSLLDRAANETEMHHFFEENPAILMEARMGIPISHAPNFFSPSDHKPDFSFSPILGPWDQKMIELMELKGPDEKTLYRGLHRGFTSKVHHAIDQVRDYDRYLHDPANLQAVLRGIGYVPDDSKLAVLIGRAPKNQSEGDIWSRRQSELDVAVVTYDEILEKQTSQVRGPYRVLSGTPAYPFDE